MAAHVLLFPWPVQGHINPMLHLASALLDAGLRVTFLHTDHNLRRLVLAAPPQHPRLRVLSVPDGLPDEHPRSVSGLMDLFDSMRTAGCAAFRALLRAEAGAVTCVVADGTMPFAVAAAQEAGFPALAFRTESACGFLCYLSVPRLLELGEVPAAASDEPVRGVPGMEGFLRRCDLPRVAPSPADADPVPVLLAVADTAARCAEEAQAVILNTAASMEAETVARIASRVRGEVFAVGPLHAMHRPAGAGVERDDNDDGGCAVWLDGHADRSVVYLNLGSLTIISADQLAELLRGVAAAGYPFLCVLRADMVSDGGQASEVLREAAAAAGKRALLVEWAAHRDVHRALQHRAVGCFLTHAGWNSVLEAAVAGVPMVCWPYFADQQTVSRFVGAVWKTGLDMKDVVLDGAVVARTVREAMEDPSIRAAAQAMAKQLSMDVAPGGSSASDMERLVGFINHLSAGWQDRPSRDDDVENSSPA